jgi:general L-amino acid transport system permease protein
MNNVNFLKPNKENLNLFLVLGLYFFALGIFDFCLNNFYEKNITGFLPGFIKFFYTFNFWNDWSSFNKN